MAYTPSTFTPSQTITSTTKLSDVDEKLQVLTDDVGDYLEQEMNAVFIDDIDPRMDEIESDYDNVKTDIYAKMDELMTVNPDGTYYTKSAIDALLTTAKEW